MVNTRSHRSFNDDVSSVVMAVLWPMLLLALLLQCCGGIQMCAAALQSRQEHDRIKELPGQPSHIGFVQYSGYVTVNSTNGRALFYWLVESMRDPANVPLLLWLNGGPGCSSVGTGMSEELGPFCIRPDGKGLFSNPYAWNRVANVLFLDSPAGVGFSYTNTSSDLIGVDDHRTAMDSYHFLVGWFERFPQYKHREFYLAGESYAGHYVPQLAHKIHKLNKGVKNPIINLKGFMVGNGVIQVRADAIGRYDYWWTNGLISDSTYNNLKGACINRPFQVFVNECRDFMVKAENEMGNINAYNIFSPLCNTTSSSMLRRMRTNHLMRGLDPCTEFYGDVYYNLPEVQKALHVVGNPEWMRCKTLINEKWNWKASPNSMLPIYRHLIKAGLKIWLFSGDVDAAVPVTSTRYAIADLKLPVVKEWYPWYLHGRVAGRCEVYEGLTFVTVRGAGHEVPLDRPSEALFLFMHFLKGTPMPDPPPSPREPQPYALFDQMELARISLGYP